MSRATLPLTSIASAMLLACAIALFAAFAAAPPGSALSRDHGASFAVRCNSSHFNSDDPIVKYGQPGAAHRHEFFGNRSTNAYSTYRSMTTTTKGTTCSRPEDRAGYWTPTVRWDGAELKSNRAVFYYRAGGKDHKTVKPFRADLKIVNSGRITWYCGSDDAKVGTTAPPTQCASGVLGLRIIFPDCVARGSDGRQVTDSSDHKSHMARSVAQSDGTRSCPSTHPIPVPTLTMNANFPLGTTSAGRVTLSSDHEGDPPGSTIHADFWNTWNQSAPLNLNPSDGRSYGGLNALVKHCINGVPPSSPRPTECRAPTATA